MSAEYANKLEVWFAGLPQLVQETLHTPFNSMNDGLKQISGNPQALLAAAPQYLDIADGVSLLGRQQMSDRQSLAAHWHGDAFDAFSDATDRINEQFNQLSLAVGQVQGLLEQGAKACVDGANMVIDLVTSLIMSALSLIAVNVALSLVTLGTSLAAGVVEVLAMAAEKLAEVARIVEKIAEVIGKIANFLRKLESSLKKILELLKRLEEYLSEAKKTAKAAKGVEGLKKTAIFNAQNAGVSKAIDWGTGGLVSPPGTVGSVKEAGSEYLDGFKDASSAVDAVD